MKSVPIRNEEDLSKWFRKNYKKLGYTKIVRDNKGAFPDFIMLKNRKKIRVELEMQSSAFKRHKHDIKKVDEIVCFRRTTNYNLPIRIIEMRGFIKDKQKNKSPFIMFFGDTPGINVLDYLLTERDLDFSITDMAKNSGIGRATLYRIWGSLIKNKIITHTRDIGKAKLYKLNKENPKIKKLIEIDDMLVMEDLKKRAKIEIPIKTR